jgi:hypothetical protein
MIPNITVGADFSGLVHYLVENRDHEVLDLQNVSSIDAAADEMASVAALNSRAKNKLLHLSLSAAFEDGVLSADQWMLAVDQHEKGFGLIGHQRVVVRHRDKTHDHVHVFWCTIAVETGQTPPKQWFLKKGCGVEGIGPHALSQEQVEAVPAEQRALRTYDFRALARSQDTCRQLERAMSLRQLRTPKQAAQARLAGEAKAPTPEQKKRAERTGSRPLIERAGEIRAALNEPDWPSKRRAICALGLDFEPYYRATRTGSQLRGLVIFDPADAGNRMSASTLDTPSVKYGWKRLEERHARGALGLEQWWPNREPVVATSDDARDRGRQRLKEAFELLRIQHDFAEREKRRQRARLLQTHRQDIARERKRLKKERRIEALKLEPSERRAFYKLYSLQVSRPALGDLIASHRVAERRLARSRKPDWMEFVRMMAAANDPAAILELESFQKSPIAMSERELRIVQRAIQAAQAAPDRSQQDVSTRAYVVAAVELWPAQMLAAYQSYLGSRGR